MTWNDQVTILYYGEYIFDKYGGKRYIISEIYLYYISLPDSQITKKWRLSFWQISGWASRNTPLGLYILSLPHLD